MRKTLENGYEFYVDDEQYLTVRRKLDEDQQREKEKKKRTYATNSFRTDRGNRNRTEKKENRTRNKKTEPGRNKKRKTETPVLQLRRQKKVK